MIKAELQLSVKYFPTWSVIRIEVQQEVGHSTPQRLTVFGGQSDQGVNSYGQK